MCFTSSSHCDVNDMFENIGPHWLLVVPAFELGE